MGTGTTYDAGVKDNHATYWEPDYKIKATGLPACFRITPPGGYSRQELPRGHPIHIQELTNG